MRTAIMQEAKDRAVRYGVENVVLPCNSGHTVRSALDEFGSDFNFYAVGNPASSHERGLVVHTGVTDAVRDELERLGVQVILQEVSLFQVNEEQEVGTHLWDAFGRSYEKRTQRKMEGKIVARFTNELLTFLLSDGPRVCLEIALMAADSGVLPLDRDCISLATPSRYCDLPDAAVILRPAKTEDFWGGGRPWRDGAMVKDVLMVPAPGDFWMKTRR